MYWLKDCGRKAKNGIQGMETRATGIETEANSEFSALIPGKCNGFFPTGAIKIPHLLTRQIAMLFNSSLNGWYILKTYLKNI